MAGKRRGQWGTAAGVRSRSPTVRRLTPHWNCTLVTLTDRPGQAHLVSAKT